jgi:uncharacterized glyoxalase superfamily protein PhnB
MIVNRSAPPGSVVPTLVYADVAAAIDWLCGAFAFTERYRYGPAGRPVGGLLLVGDGGVMLTVARVGQGFREAPDSAELRPPRPSETTHVVSVRVDDVDAHHEQARAFGARILQPPTDYPFGERQYTAEDLGGHRWTFTQSIADIAPEDWGATVVGQESDLGVLE